MAYETIEYEVGEGGVARLTLNRPHVLNAISREVLRDLRAAIQAAESDDSVRAVVLAGAGRSFCAGFDLKQESGEESHPAEAWIQRFRDDFECFFGIWRSAKPYVAAVQGHCLGGGLEMMLCCDFAVAADDATFGKPEIRMGGGVGPGMLLWFVGIRAARRLLLLSERIGAPAAARLGLIDRVVPRERLLEEAEEIARTLAGLPPIALRLNKKTINEHYERLGLSASISHNLAMTTVITSTEEARSWEKRLRSAELKDFLRELDKNG